MWGSEQDSKGKGALFLSAPGVGETEAAAARAHNAETLQEKTELLSSRRGCCIVAATIAARKQAGIDRAGPPAPVVVSDAVGIGRLLVCPLRMPRKARSMVALCD